MRRFLTGPLGLALVVTLANAAKPAVIDDTAYLTYARQIAHHPLDPYGFEVFWYNAPEPAMEVLCPPVVPYWLALGVRLFGEHVGLLKLSLFPFVWLLAWSLTELLRRFARGTERFALPLVILSPAVLPTVNLMLDIPALALGLGAVVLFIRSAKRRSWRLAVASGLVAGLAIQTKYTALLVPAVIGWYGLTHRAIRPAAVAVATAVLLFAGWESLLIAKYGRSHFLFHAGDQQARTEGANRLAAFVNAKVSLAPPLAGHLGCLAGGAGLVAVGAVGVPRRVTAVAAGLWLAGFTAVCLISGRDAVLIHGRAPGVGELTLPAVVWRTAGSAVLFVAAGCAAVLLVRWRNRPSVRRSPDSLFIVGWVLIELAGYFVLTPFPAARRVIGPAVLLGLLAARTLSRMRRVRSDRRPPRWVLPFAVAAGFLVTALDTWDAYPEKTLADRAADLTSSREPGARVWFVGHWGFQFYCERAGMIPAVAGESRLAAGDYLVLPRYPDPEGFYRPYPGRVVIAPPPDVAELLAEFTWDDRLAAQTLPNFYGGTDPVVGRDHPRLRVGVYRLRRDWLATGP